MFVTNTSDTCKWTSQHSPNLKSFKRIWNFKMLWKKTGPLPQPHCNILIISLLQGFILKEFPPDWSPWHFLYWGVSCNMCMSAVSLVAEKVDPLRKVVPEGTDSTSKCSGYSSNLLVFWDSLSFDLWSKLRENGQLH
jgi:hypothetical protein